MKESFSNINIEDGGNITYNGNNPRQYIQLSGAGITPATTNGCNSPEVLETSTNKVCIRRAEFTDGSDQSGWWTILMPLNWDGTIKVERIAWSADAGSTGNTVEWEISAVGGGDDDTLDAVVGTAVSISDAITSTGDRQICGSGSSLTPSGSPSAGEEIHFKITRDVSAGTLSQSAFLHEVLISIGVSSYS